MWYAHPLVNHLLVFSAHLFRLAHLHRRTLLQHATACYCMLLHATAECSVSVSVSHCEATQAESKVFYQKMKARMSVDCID